MKFDAVEYKGYWLRRCDNVPIWAVGSGPTPADTVAYLEADLELEDVKKYIDFLIDVTELQQGKLQTIIKTHMTNLDKEIQKTVEKQKEGNEWTNFWSQQESRAIHSYMELKAVLEEYRA